jgi:type II secretory pathway component GspD/PulD (secretin)
MRNRLIVAGLLGCLNLAANAAEEHEPGAGLSARIDPATNTLRLNFHGAPLSAVLEHLSAAAGFVINLETPVQGTVDLWSRDPVTKEEALQLLASVLKKHGCTVVRNGRILNIVALDSAKTANLEVETAKDPGLVPKTDEIVTELIPVRYANAAQLAKNLEPLLPASAHLSVNDGANALVMVATRRDIHRMLQIVTALDSSIARVNSIRVFPLKHADAKQLATVLQQLFSPQSTTDRASVPGGFNFGSPGGFGPPGFGGGPGSFSGGPGGAVASGGATRGAGSAGANNASKLIAAADETSNSLIVSGGSDVLTEVARVVEQLDRPVAGATEVRLFRLVHADPTELAEQITQLFPDDSKNNSGGNDAGFRFGGPPGPPFFQAAAAAQDQTGGRSAKQARVLAVPDPRSSSLLVSAASSLMPHIDKMIEQLDANPARREVVKVHDLHNADVQRVNEVLQDLFNRNNTMRNNNNNRNSLVGQNNPLEQRETGTQAQSGNTGFGNRTGGGGGVGGAGVGGTGGP